jgi:hypothetical protein
MFRLSSIIFLCLIAFSLTIGQSLAAEPPIAPMGVAVTLDYFEAVPDANGVRVVWATLNEQNTSGFRVYRAASANGPLTLLTALIPTQAPNGGGARYEFVDQSARVGNVYYYYLDAVGTNGQTLRYGPTVIDLNPTAVTVASMMVASENNSWGWLPGITLIGIAAMGIVVALRFPSPRS